MKNNNNDESKASKIIRMIRARQEQESDDFQFPDEYYKLPKENI